MDEPRTVAAVDLGSNSFHMIVARWSEGQLHVVDKLRERVALAEGFDSRRNLRAEAWERALECLGRFGERLHGLPVDSVRAVGTYTLRRARNAREFLTEAEAALGHSIEIVAGHEEARLIYLGAAEALGFDEKRRLVVDIGGGSTEFILGEGRVPLERDSVSMGCVRFGLKYFGDRKIRRSTFEDARIAGRIQMRSFERRYRGHRFEEAVGCSGTIKAIGAILRANGWSNDGITVGGLERLQQELVEAGHVDRLGGIEGLEPDRATVIAPGLAVLRAVFEGLRIERMAVSHGALRDGLLVDLVGRIGSEDVREQTIAGMQQRYGVDTDHAERVELAAVAVLHGVAEAWALELDEAERFVRWAARLHDIGLSIAHGGYHRHGAYLIRHSAMPGFSRNDQEMLAALVLGHRRRLTPQRLQEHLPSSRLATALRLTLCLRIACRLHRKRTGRDLPRFKVRARGRKVTLKLPQEWLAEHPLTLADLDDERVILEDAGFILSVVASG